MHDTEVRAILKTARISAFKARAVTRHIQGMRADDAMKLLRFSPQKAARLVERTLKSAMANAENNNGFSRDRLFVSEAVVGEGPTFKRFQPKARGSAGPIRKRTSHIRITLIEADEMKDVPQKESRKKAKRSDRPSAESGKPEKRQSEKKDIQANQSSK